MKSEMCRHWLKNKAKGLPPRERCPLGNKCKFAHGELELELNSTVSKGTRESRQVAIQKDAEQRAFQEQIRRNDALSSIVAEGIKRQEEESKVVEEPQEGELDLATIHGELGLGATGEVQGRSAFGCAVAQGHKDIAYFEVELLSVGVVQVGWVTQSFEANESDGVGVGDQADSLAIDPARKICFAHGKEVWLPSMPDVQEGDVLGFGSSKEKLWVCLNGSFLHAFPKVDEVYPAVSLNQHEQVRFAFSQFAFPSELPALPVVQEESKVFSVSSASSAQEMETLGLDALKEELMQRGVKCGGNLQQRAERLFLVRDLDEIPKKLRAKKK